MAEAQRVEQLRCPKCGEIHFLERDEQNCSPLPEPCACGHRFGLNDLFGQMQQQQEDGA